MRGVMAADPPQPRTRSVRLTLVSLLLIPLLSLVALWGFTASVTLGNIVRYQHYHSIISTIGPSVSTLEQALPVERAVTLIWLGGGRRSAPPGRTPRSAWRTPPDGRKSPL